MNKKLPPRFLPAPMEGIMRGCFCKVAAEMGLVDGWLTNFLRINSAGRLPDKTLKEFLAPFLTTPIPVFVQLMGDNGELIAETASRLLEISSGIAGFDLNLGCPSHAVVRHPGVGGGVWKNPEIPLQVLSAMRERLGPGVVLSIKCRTGNEDFRECIPWIPQWVEAGKLDWISVHYRTVKEGYRQIDKKERSKRFAAVAACTSVPLWLNGDFQTLEEAEEEIDRISAPAAGALLGRSWLKSPGIFRSIPAEKAALEFYNRAVNHPDGISRGHRIELGKWLLGEIIL